MMPAEPSRAGQKHNILAAVSGQTPAIITETLWALQSRREIEVDQIRVITTSKGRESIIRNLFGDSGKFTSFCRDYHIPPGRIAFSEKDIYVLRGPRGEELEDIRDTKENAVAADQVFSLIREWAKREDEILYCSVAGGRKTLGIYLTMAMMLCGRMQDRLYHVLVSKEFESGVPDFYYPPPESRIYPKFVGIDEAKKAIQVEISSEEARIDLAEIPFPRLRELIGGELPLEKGLTTAVESSQLLLTYLQAPPPLSVNLHKSKVEVGHFTFPLSRQLLAVYAFLLITASASPSGLSIENLFDGRQIIADLERRIDSYKAGEQEEYAWEKIRDMADFRDRIRPCISKINHAIYSAAGRNRFAEQLTIHTGRYIKVSVANFQIIEAGGKRWKPTR
jgi:CRISPR-associated protein (TIGR02584 family)